MRLQEDPSELLCKRMAWSVAQTIRRHLSCVVKTSLWKVAVPHEAPEPFTGVGGLKVPMHPLRKVVKGEGFLCFLYPTAHGLGRALVVLSECSPPMGREPPLCWLAPSCQPVQLEQLRALVEGWHARQRWRGVAENSALTEALSPS